MTVHYESSEECKQLQCGGYSVRSLIAAGCVMMTFLFSD